MFVHGNGVRILALLTAIAAPACVAADDLDVEDGSGEAGEVDEARSALYTAPGTCTYGAGCNRYTISSPGWADYDGCGVRMSLDVRKNGESVWTNVKNATRSADGPGFVSSGAHITDYTAHSISAVRWQLVGPAGCRFRTDLWPRVTRKIYPTGAADKAYYLNLNPGNTEETQLCNGTMPAFPTTTISPVQLVPGLTLTQYRAGIGPHPNGENAPSCYFAPVPSQVFSHADIADNAPLFPGSSDRIATIAVFGLDL